MWQAHIEGITPANLALAFAIVSAVILVISIDLKSLFQLRYHVSGEAEFKPRTMVPSNANESGNPDSDKCDWGGEYYRLRSLFHKTWNSPGMRRIAKSVHDVTFGGVEASNVQRTFEDSDIANAAQRNAELFAVFGTMTSDVRKYFFFPKL
jgi:hypothetical protein